MHTRKKRNINLSFNEKLPESAGTWELCDKSLICLPRFIYWLILKEEECILHSILNHILVSSHVGKSILYLKAQSLQSLHSPPLPATLDPVCLEPQEYNSVSLNLCFSNQNAPSVKVIWVFFQLLLCLLHLLWDVLGSRLQNDKGESGTMVSMHRTASRGTPKGRHVVTNESFCVLSSLK